MLLYAILMLSTAVLLLSVSIAIIRGKTQLIHSYHQSKVRDKAAYGKAFGTALLVFSAAPLGSGLIALLGKGKAAAMTAVAVLAAGFAIGFVCLLAVQKKYNGGLF